MKLMEKSDVIKNVHVAAVLNTKNVTAPKLWAFPCVDYVSSIVPYSLDFPKYFFANIASLVSAAEDPNTKLIENLTKEIEALKLAIENK